MRPPPIATRRPLGDTAPLTVLRRAAGPRQRQCAVLLALLTSACALQPPAHTGLPPVPVAWRNLPAAEALPDGQPLAPDGGVAAGTAPAAGRQPGAPDAGSAVGTASPGGTATVGLAPGFTDWDGGDATDAQPTGAEDWWRALQDPAIDALVPLADRNSATLAQALARIEEARAGVAQARSGSLPHLNTSVSGQRGTNTSVLPTTVEEQATAALSLSWEIDLFGRLRHASAAARAQLDARDADARLTRLSLDAQVADTVLQRRACMLTLARQRETLQSSLTTLRLTQIKMEAGFSAPLEVARSRTSVGEARQAVTATEGECRRDAEILVNLSGADFQTIDQALADGDVTAPPELPEAPALAPALPASVLAAHPGLVSARRNADLAFEQVGQARAARLPSVNLAGALSTSWIKFSNIDQGVNAWSIGPSLAMPLFDAGNGAAGVEAARARYDGAIAALRQTLRDAVRDVEFALIDGDAAGRRVAAADETSRAARDLFTASRAAQQAGRLSLFDLEIARSSLLSAQTNLIAARRDAARAWVALVKATGNGVPLPAAALGSDPLPLRLALGLASGPAVLAGQPVPLAAMP